MRKMTFIRKREDGRGRLKMLTNFQITDELREAIRQTRGVNYLLSNILKAERHEIELAYAPLVGPAGTENEIRATVKQFFTNQK